MKDFARAVLKAKLQKQGQAQEPVLPKRTSGMSVYDIPDSWHPRRQPKPEEKPAPLPQGLVKESDRKRSEFNKRDGARKLRLVVMLTPSEHEAVRKFCQDHDLVMNRWLARLIMDSIRKADPNIVKRKPPPKLLR